MHWQLLAQRLLHIVIRPYLLDEHLQSSPLDHGFVISLFGVSRTHAVETLTPFVELCPISVHRNDSIIKTCQACRI